MTFFFFLSLVIQCKNLRQTYVCKVRSYKSSLQCSIFQLIEASDEDEDEGCEMPSLIRRQVNNVLAVIFQDDK